MSRIPLLSLVIGLLSVACSSNTETADPGMLADREQSVSFAEAVATASAEVPDGVPYEVELERLDGRDVIEVEFLVGATVREVYIDPVTGEVLAVRDEAEENTEQSAEELDTQASMMGSAQITLAQAAQIASDHAGAEATEVEFKVMDGQLVAEVEVEGANVVLIDATSGNVIDMVPEQDEDEDDDEEE